MSAKHQPKFRRFVEHENFSVIDAMDKLFPAWFSGESWNTWRVVLKAAFCLKMTEDEIAIFRTVAGGRAPPRKRVRELWIVAGRRAGKDSVASLVATYSAVFFCADLRELRPGEKAVVQCLACDRSQAQIILNYVRSYFDHVAPLRSMVTRRTATGLELQNDVCIEIGTNSYKSVRGRAFLLSILDEVAFYQDENSARPDTETYNAVKPGLATLPGSMLIGISSPYRKSGLLYTKYKKHFAQDDDTVLVIQAPSLALNPTLDPEIIEKAMEDDPAVARAEWMAEWRDDVSGFVDADVVAACVSPGVRELPPMRGYHYVGFCDPSGGSSDRTMAPTSQKMLVTTAQRQSRVSDHNSPNNLAVEPRMLGLIARSGAACPVLGMNRLAPQHSSAKTIIMTVSATGLPPPVIASPPVIVPPRIARKVAPSTSAVPAGNSSRFR